MAILKIGIQTRSLRRPLKQALHIAAELGADGVEIDARHEIVPAQLSQTGFRQLRKLLDDLNLKIAAVAFPTRRGYDVAEDLERRVLATRSALEFAYKIGANVVINRVGGVPDDSQDERFGRLVESLTALGTYGEKAGARLAIQTTDDGHRLATLLSRLPPESVGVDLHPSGLILHGHSPLEVTSLLGPHVLHLHACDAVRDLARGQGLEVELGRGTADFPALLAALEEFGYRGWATIERLDAGDPVAEIGNAVAYLRSL